MIALQHPVTGEFYCPAWAAHCPPLDDPEQTYGEVHEHTLDADGLDEIRCATCKRLLWMNDEAVAEVLADDEPDTDGLAEAAAQGRALARMAAADRRWRSGLDQRTPVTPATVERILANLAPTAPTTTGDTFWCTPEGLHPVYDAFSLANGATRRQLCPACGATVEAHAAGDLAPIPAHPHRSHLAAA